MACGLLLIIVCLSPFVHLTCWMRLLLLLLMLLLVVLLLLPVLLLLLLLCFLLLLHLSLCYLLRCAENDAAGFHG